MTMVMRMKMIERIGVDGEINLQRGWDHSGYIINTLSMAHMV